ncbi:GDSL-type esterase/lipase family protein [Pedobacter sp. P351]|uniref:GDSL-type esterase/lipase family protein n=1 Tax=Pedobacter superstes TaxID=3133441 RepID=UPI00309ABAC5
MRYIFISTIIHLMFAVNSLAQKVGPGVLAPVQVTSKDSLIAKPGGEIYVKFDDTRNATWPAGFEVVEIQSSKDASIQKSYFYKTLASKPKPIIVSLHTWSGDYRQKDEVAPICKRMDLNYIHPNFRGANRTDNACSSELALADIDDAISFAIKNANVDISKIYVIGVSGGGYATLSTFMNSRHTIKKFSAWASITSLEAWFHESTILKNKYAADIFSCTGSKDEFNIENARRKSPLYMNTPISKLKDSEVFIFAGIYDGLQGSVPITHSINFYNKLLSDLSVRDKLNYVSLEEKVDLLEHRRPLGVFGKIGDRKIYLKKKYGNVELTIFEGDHEMLPDYAMNQLLNDSQPLMLSDKSLNILTLGDSNGSYIHSWPEQLKLAMPNAEVFNISKSGRTIGFLNLGDSTLNSLAVIENNLKMAAEHTKSRPYDFILLQLGTNDGKAVFANRQKEVPKNLEKLIIKIQTSSYETIRKAKIVIISPPPYGLKAEATEKYAGGDKRMKTMSRAFMKIASRNNCLFVNGFRTPGLNMETMTDDGLHLDAIASRKLIEPVVSLLGK